MNFFKSNYDMNYKDPIENRVNVNYRLDLKKNIKMLCGTDISNTRMYESSYFDFQPRFEIHDGALFLPYREPYHIPKNRIFEHWAYDKFLKPILIADHYKPVLIGYSDHANLPVYPFKQAYRVKEVKGESYYMGLLNPHYGHFIQESITRLWLALDNPDFVNEKTNYVFHVFSNFTKEKKEGFFNSSLMLFLNAMKISKKQIIFVEENTIFENIIIPEAAIAISDGNCYLSYAARKVWLEINRNMAGKSDCGLGKRKIYLSRRAVENPIQGRLLKNERQLEGALRELDFDIVIPEEITQFDMQEILRDTKVIVANPGSGLQNSFFIPNNAITIGLTCLPVMKINPGLNHQINTDIVCGHKTLGVCANTKDIDIGKKHIHWGFDIDRLALLISDNI